MYFRLHSHCVLNQNLIYDLLNQIQHPVPDLLFSILQQYVQKNSTIEIEKVFSNEIIQEFKKFVTTTDIGEFTDYPCTSEVITIGNHFSNLLTNTLPFFINQVVIELTGRCNLNCKFCNNQDVVYRSCGCKQWTSDYELSDPDFMRILEEVISLNPRTVVFSGGEPLLRWSLLKKMIERLSAYHITSMVYTNGELLTDEIMTALLNHKVSLIWQLTGIDSQYNIITKSNTQFVDVLTRILHYKRCGGSVLTEFTIFRENEKSIDEIEDFLIKSDLNYVKAYIYPPNKYAVNNVYDRAICHAEKIIPVDITNFEFYNHFNRCLAFSVFISSLGMVHPCMMLRNCTLGNLKKEHLFQVFQREEYKKYWKLAKPEIEFCENCGYNICCNDCRAIEFQATSDLKGMFYCDKRERVLL